MSGPVTTRERKTTGVRLTARPSLGMYNWHIERQHAIETLDAEGKVTHTGYEWRDA